MSNSTESTDLAAVQNERDALEAFDLMPKRELAGFYQQNRDDLDTPITFEALFDDASLLGLSEEDVTLGTGTYRVLSGAEKAELINRPFGLRAWKFSRGDMGGYVICYAIIAGTDEAVIFTDGSTGIYATLNRLSSKRLKAEHVAPFEYLKAPNGLRVSEYGLNELGRPAEDGEKVVGKGRTYYFA